MIIHFITKIYENMGYRQFIKILVKDNKFKSLILESINNKDSETDIYFHINNASSLLLEWTNIISNMDDTFDIEKFVEMIASELSEDISMIDYINEGREKKFHFNQCKCERCYKKHECINKLHEEIIKRINRAKTNDSKKESLIRCIDLELEKEQYLQKIKNKMKIKNPSIKFKSDSITNDKILDSIKYDIKELDQSIDITNLNGLSKEIQLTKLKNILILIPCVNIII